MIQYIIAAGIGALLGSSGKKPKKMGHGGKTQGYNSRLDESLSMRHGAGRKKQQTRKDRRDESAAMERSMGRRKYASVSTMDKGRRKMAQGGTIVGAGKSGLDKIKKTSKDNPSQMYMVTDDNYTNIGRFYLKNGKFAKKTVANADYDFFHNKVSLRPKSDVIYKAIEIEGKGGYYAKGGKTKRKEYVANLPEHKKWELVKDVTDRSINKMDSDGQMGALFEYGHHDLTRKFVGRDKALQKAHDDKATFDLPTMNFSTSEFAHGGKTQGYNARLDESLGMRRGSKRTKKQGYKSRRHESEGMERSMGRRKYASVGTMDKGRKRMALGGMAGRISPMEMQQIILDKTGKLLDPSTQAFANEAGALGYLYALFGDYYTKSMQKGGKTSSAEERAFAEYMEDYGVDREQAEYEFRGEFKSKADWAAEYIDDVGGLTLIFDTPRFYDVDKVGFREWAMNMAEALSSDLDDDELEDRAERHGLKFEYMEAEEMGGDAMKNFRREIEEKEYDEYYDYFMSEGESVEGVLDLIANYHGGGVEEALDQYVLNVDYDEVADALEDDGFVFIEKDFKTFVFDPNMARGGRTKCTSCNKNRMKKGGRTKSRKKVSDFDKLAMKVAARYRAEGKSNEEAMEIGRGTAAKVYRQQQAKGGAKRRKGRK